MDYREALVWPLPPYCLDMADSTLIADLKSSDKESNNESSHGSDIDIQEECQGKN